MVDPRAALRNVGLSDKEAHVYMALLSLGESVVYSIAERSGLKPPTTYVTLNRLVQKGYAKRIPRARKQLYFPVSVDEVFSGARARLHESEQALPELHALSRFRDQNKVRTTYYEGQDQVLSAFLDTLNYPDREVSGWLSEQPWRSTDGKDWWHREYRPRRLAKNIYHRFIVPNVSSMHEYAREGPELHKEVRIECDASFAPQTDILFYGNRRVLITSFTEKMGVILESTHIHDTQKAIFERHWETLAR